MEHPAHKGLKATQGPQGLWALQETQGQKVTREIKEIRDKGYLGILPSCPAGQVLVSAGSSEWQCKLLCSGSFVEPLTNQNNCGSCGTTCFAGQLCVGGSCQGTPAWCGDGICNNGIEDCASCPQDCGECMSCGAGTTACENKCVPLASDFFNCGGCGIACAQGQSCFNGQCTAITGNRSRSQMALRFRFR